jgi:hypothetical protein
MTMLDVFALLAGAALGWASGSLKAHLHCLRRPQASLRAGGSCHPDLVTLPAPGRDQPRAVGSRRVAHVGVAGGSAAARPGVAPERASASRLR